MTDSNLTLQDADIDVEQIQGAAEQSAEWLQQAQQQDMLLDPNQGSEGVGTESTQQPQQEEG